MLRARGAQVIQDVAEPPVHFFEHGDVLLGQPALEPAQARDGVIHPRITGGWRLSHGPFGIKILIFIPCTLVWVFVIHPDCGMDTRPSRREGNAASPPITFPCCTVHLNRLL
jgi:hypothetical protein